MSITLTSVPSPEFIFKAASDILPCTTFVSIKEQLFVEQIYRDITTFVNNSISVTSALIFPPFNPRLRYLVHQISQSNFSDFKTFSVGSSECRRTVICLHTLFKDPEEQFPKPKMESEQSETKQQKKNRALRERPIYRPPPARVVKKTTDTEHTNDHEKDNKIDSPSTNAKRPDLPIYVPKVLRQQAVKAETNENKSPEHQKRSPDNKLEKLRRIGRTQAPTQLNLTIEDVHQTPNWNEDSKGTLAPPQVTRKISRSCSVGGIVPSIVEVGELMESSELAELTNEVHEELSTDFKNISGGEDGSWETLYNETGDSLRPEALEELTLAVGSVKILEPIHDAYSVLSMESHDEDLTHVLEVYDFPASFKTEDVFNALSCPGRPPDFSIKWVDDTHALAIYSSTNSALDALSVTHGVAKVRPLAQACRESRLCARRISTALQPFKPRPQTSASLARRLVSTALGLKNTTSPEQRKMERQMLADAKEKKRLAARQREAAWDGTIAMP